MLTTSINNSTSKNIGHIGFYEYFVVLILIFYAANANKLVLFTSFKDQPLVFFVPVLLSIILVLKHNIQFNKNFYLLIFFYMFYFLAITIKYRTFYPSLLVHYPAIFFTSYVIIKTFKFELFSIYEYLIYILSIIGLGFWVVQIAMGGDTLYGLISHIPKIEDFSHVTGGGFNIILYSVQPSSFSLIYNHLPARNCGFAWEPGAFAVYLCLAIFINLFFSSPGKSQRRRLLVMLLAMLSTQSTTGFITLLLIGIFYYFNTNLKTIFLVIPLAVVGIVFVFSLPFMSEKIIGLVEDVQRVDYVVAASYGRETSVTPQRFVSFVIAIKDFFLNPVLGTGGISGESWTDKIGVNISAISGIGTFLGQYGLVGFLFFIITTIRSSFQFSKYYNFRGKLLLLLIVLSISVSYGILFFPLITCFWIYALFQSGETRLETQ